ncbi:MAG: tRNA pseudouridine(55) synthase TruB [Lentisphaerae bacterium GWF2_45_14]|nr:MAG: tRNA pseudouridine(55) synthase TruB [Lentisphaerae bacterium GWF2_45_14]
MRRNGKFNSGKHGLSPFQQSGVLLVDKPKEWTSFDVVNFVRSRFNIPKTGHCGTLDPAATGLLVLVLGRFTKLSQKFSGEDKVYDASILLGTETDSQDMDGKIIRTADPSGVTEKQLRDTFNEFIGEQQQIPPMVSAVKIDGKKLYELARKGEEIERDPKDITIYSLDVKSVNLPYADFSVHCSKGTYIRTLCSDIGSRLGCGAVLNGLKRTSSGSFMLSDAVSVETLKEWEQPELEAYLSDFLYRKISSNPQFSSI